MERKRFDIAQVYGYTVCLLAVLVFLAASAALADGIMDLREPPYTASFRSGPSLVTEEAYRLDLQEQVVSSDASRGTLDVWLPADSTVGRMYERERLYRLALSHQASRKRIWISVVLLVLSLGLFVGHWTWLLRRERTTGGA